MDYYCVESKSRKDLRKIAQSLRENLGIKNVIKVPIVHLLDVFCSIFDNFSYEIVPDSDMKSGKHAETDITNAHVKIRQSVYSGACEGNGRDRMTIAHELGHFITLCVLGFSLSLCPSKKETYNDPEWQAKCFAGEFMIDYDLTKDMTAKEISKACGVSLKAARYQTKYRNTIK